jgi:hypothetical protein
MTERHDLDERAALQGPEAGINGYLAFWRYYEHLGATSSRGKLDGVSLIHARKSHETRAHDVGEELRTLRNVIRARAREVVDPDNADRDRHRRSDDQDYEGGEWQEWPDTSGAHRAQLDRRGRRSGRRADAERLGGASERGRRETHVRILASAGVFRRANALPTIDRVRQACSVPLYSGT